MAVSGFASIATDSIAQARLEAVQWNDIIGWTADDHAAALVTFKRSASPAHAAATIRTAQAPSAALLRVLDDAGSVSVDQARSFFEQRFQAFAIRPDTGAGFLTAYFEPEFPASRTRTPAFSAPMLSRPQTLVTLHPDDPHPLPDQAHLTAALVSNGTAAPAPTRSAIEAGALDDLTKVIAWLDPVDLFFVHVQGSSRLRFADGSVVRCAYAGRNGHPYSSIGKRIVAEGHMPLETMTLEGLMGWLKANQHHAKRIMQTNDSYIFFQRAEDLGEQDGPIGGAGHPLSPHRSMAVDRAIWSYGLPFFVQGHLPVSLDQNEPLARLMIAQDTGSAILGAARADYFMGSGAEAGRRAGLVRHKADFTVLWPKD